MADGGGRVVKLTPAQVASLRHMITANPGSDHDGWAVFGGRYDSHDILPHISTPTAHRLLALGLIEVHRPGGYEGTEIVTHGWAGGWHTRPVFSKTILKITAAGRAAAEAADG